MPSSTTADDSASKRKRREGPRTPSRGRGVARYGALLDATDALLQVENPDTIGLYQIAEQAGVPPASVYHFFPTKEAAYVALAERYLEGLMEVHRAPIEARLLGGWQDLLQIDFRRAMEFYNARPPMNKILYGGYGGIEARNIDKLFSLKLANAHYDRLDRIFHMPFMSSPGSFFENRLGILDALWSISVRRYGSITEEYLLEAQRACAAYTLVYLPQYLEPRELLVEAAARGESLTLAFDLPAQDDPAA